VDVNLPTGEDGMANDDRTLLATYRWFRQAVGKALEQIPEIPKRQQVGGLIWQLLGLTADANGQIPRIRLRRSRTSLQKRRRSLTPRW